MIFKNITQHHFSFSISCSCRCLLGSVGWFGLGVSCSPMVMVVPLLIHFFGDASVSQKLVWDLDRTPSLWFTCLWSMTTEWQQVSWDWVLKFPSSQGHSVLQGHNNKLGRKEASTLKARRFLPGSGYGSEDGNNSASISWASSGLVRYLDWGRQAVWQLVMSYLFGDLRALSIHSSILSLTQRVCQGYILGWIIFMSIWTEAWVIGEEGIFIGKMTP